MIISIFVCADKDDRKIIFLSRERVRQIREDKLRLLWIRLPALLEYCLGKTVLWFRFVLSCYIPGFPAGPKDPFMLVIVWKGEKENVKYPRVRPALCIPGVQLKQAIFPLKNKSIF